MALKTKTLPILTLTFALLTSVTLAGPSIRKSRQAGPVTCPGFPGYCSESNPGDTCLVVCAFGRNNVPECQPDGTWTDAPRCIEHEPGIPEQVPGICPGIPGYCSLSHAGGLCEFDCASGPDIRSICTQDGTWDPYPTCDGDIRETKDGCDPCPGPFGGPRNRKAEQTQGQSRNTNPVLNVIQPSRQTNFSPAKRPQRLNVVQPARQTGFQSAPQPTNLASNAQKNNNRFNQGGNNFQNTRNNNRNDNNRFQNNRNNVHNNRNNNFQNNRNNIQNQRNSFQNNRNNQRNFQKNRKNQQNFQNPRNGVRDPAPITTPRSFQRNQGKNVQSNHKASSGSNCPGGSLEICIDVCPSFSARIFGACVAGCARRCPNGKKK